MQDTRSLKTNIRWPVSPGLAGALVLLIGGERTRAWHGVLDAMRNCIREREGKTKCGDVKGGLR